MSRSIEAVPACLKGVHPSTRLLTQAAQDEDYWSMALG